MITLSLLHPVKQSPVQVWTFPDKSVIRIGRSTDNHVILYSAVVSRHHVELRRVESGWELTNFGANGTYLDGKRVNQGRVTDGSIIRLARSGPNIQIRLGEAALREYAEPLHPSKAVPQRPELPLIPTEITGEHSEGPPWVDLNPPDEGH